MLCARQDFARRRKGRVFVLIVERRAIELRKLKGGKILACAAFSDQRADARELVGGLAARSKRAGSLFEQRFDSGDRVEDAGMAGRLEQRLMLVLTVELE